MFASGSQLAQSRPSGTSATSVYTASIRTEITRIVICNTTSGTVQYSIYHDDDGSTFTEDTALFFSVNIAAYTTDVIDFSGVGSGIMVARNGQIGVKTNTGSAITFSFYGITGAV